MSSDSDQKKTTPFITAYGEFPLVVMTEFGRLPEQVSARVVRPRELALLGSGRSWEEAHWVLFNALLSEYMNLERNRTQLNERHQQQLFQLDCLRADGTLRLIAGIARHGFPEALHEAERSRGAPEGRG